VGAGLVEAVARGVVQLRVVRTLRAAGAARVRPVGRRRQVHTEWRRVCQQSGPARCHQLVSILRGKSEIKKLNTCLAY